MQNYARRGHQNGVRVVRRQVRQGRYVLEYETPDYDYADTIIGVDGNQVTTYSDLIRLIENKKPGDTVTVNVIRDKKKLDIQVVLGEQK